MAEPQPERPKEPPAKTAVDQYRRLEAETSEEENTERARFFDIYERLSHNLSMIRAFFLQKKVDVDAKVFAKATVDEWGTYISIFRELETILEDARFDDGFAKKRQSSGMGADESVGYEYQVLNARGRKALEKSKAILIAMGIVPMEDPRESLVRVIADGGGKGHG